MGNYLKGRSLLDPKKQNKNVEFFYICAPLLQWKPSKIVSSSDLPSVFKIWTSGSFKQQGKLSWYLGCSLIFNPPFFTRTFVHGNVSSLDLMFSRLAISSLLGDSSLAESVFESKNFNFHTLDWYSSPRYIFMRAQLPNLISWVDDRRRKSDSFHSYNLANYWFLEWNILMPK